MEREVEHQDGMIAKYLLSKGLPESVEITTIRLARFCGKRLEPEILASFSAAELRDFKLRGWTKRLRLKAREDLKNSLRTQRVFVEGKTYRVRRIEDWPEYRVGVEVEGLDNNGFG